MMKCCCMNVTILNVVLLLKDNKENKLIFKFIMLVCGEPPGLSACVLYFVLPIEQRKVESSVFIQKAIKEEKNKESIITETG